MVGTSVHDMMTWTPKKQRKATGIILNPTPALGTWLTVSLFLKNPCWVLVQSLKKDVLVTINQRKDRQGGEGHMCLFRQLPFRCVQSGQSQAAPIWLEWRDFRRNFQTNLFFEQYQIRSEWSTKFCGREVPWLAGSESCNSLCLDLQQAWRLYSCTSQLHLEILLSGLSHNW